MPQFQLDTAGTVHNVRAPSIEAVKRVDLSFEDLDAFTQGYIEAMFFTSTGNAEDDDLEEAGFSDLAPETLSAIIADCQSFRNSAAWRGLMAAEAEELVDRPDDDRAGHDFWLTRNGHGAGFWDGDWPDPHAEALTDAADQFPTIDIYRGDDGMIYA